MAYNKIRPIDRSCGSYRPGHQVHWIQAKKAVEEQQPVIDVAVVVHDDGRVGIEGDELRLTLWNHNPDRLRSALGYWGPGGVEAEVSRPEPARALRLRIQHGSVARKITVQAGWELWPLRPPRQRTPWWRAAGSEGRSRVHSAFVELLARDVVEGQGKDERRADCKGED